MMHNELRNEIRNARAQYHANDDQIIARIRAFALRALMNDRIRNDSIEFMIDMRDFDYDASKYAQIDMQSHIDEYCDSRMNDDDFDIDDCENDIDYDLIYRALMNREYQMMISRIIRDEFDYMIDRSILMMRGD